LNHVGSRSRHSSRKSFRRGQSGQSGEGSDAVAEAAGRVGVLPALAGRRVGIAARSIVVIVVVVRPGTGRRAALKELRGMLAQVPADVPAALARLP